MAEVVDTHKLQRLQERYPFSKDELEILVRAHDNLQNPNDTDDFLMKLARASPFQIFFLPGDELEDRMEWIEDHILPPGFANGLRAAVSVDAFVEYANQGEDKSLERFLEGIADTGRRGPKEALRLIFRLRDQPDANELVDVCVRLAIASDVLVTPKLNKDEILKEITDLAPAIESLSQSLMGEYQEEEPLQQQVFLNWAEEYVPMLSTPLSTFLHRVLFHKHAYPIARGIPYTPPKLDVSSHIFQQRSSPLMLLSMTSPRLGGKWHRIYSSILDGHSFNRLEWSLVGYTGPTLVIVKTTGRSVLGAYASTPWKDARGEFYGNSDCFLFELEPKFMVHRAEGNAENFMYMHSSHDQACHLSVDHPHGLGFGGTVDKPRLFIPESFEQCSADFFDKTFEVGELLPLETLERFEIQTLEVFGVGGDETIKKALENRAAHRERLGTAIDRARKVHDKTQFAQDFKSGLIPNKLYQHQEEVRGRHDFEVDDKHGGYKVQ